MHKKGTMQINLLFIFILDKKLLDKYQCIGTNLTNRFYYVAFEIGVPEYRYSRIYLFDTGGSKIDFCIETAKNRLMHFSYNRLCKKFAIGPDHLFQIYISPYLLSTLPPVGGFFGCTPLVKS